VLNGAINHYNSALTTAYNRITTLEAEVTHLWGELTRLPGGNITSKTKVPEPPTFVGSENKIHLYDWLSQIALYCSASGIISYDKVQAGLSIGSWGNFVQELKNIYRQ